MKKKIELDEIEKFFDNEEDLKKILKKNWEINLSNIKYVKLNENAYKKNNFCLVNLSEKLSICNQIIKNNNSTNSNLLDKKIGKITLFFVFFVVLLLGLIIILILKKRMKKRNRDNKTNKKSKTKTIKSFNL